MMFNWTDPSNTSDQLQSQYCQASHVSISATAFFITRAVVIVPFAVWVLFLGHRRWWQRQQQPVSHYDVITYHMAVMQLTEAPGLVFFLLGYPVPSLSVVGFSILSLTMVGEILFHVLTCVERYLAVLHPITYLKLKNTIGVTIRNVCVGLVWVFALGWGALVVLYFPGIPFVQLFSLSSLSFAVVSFCSFSVLRVLVRPRPGDVCGDGVDRSKKKAFRTIMTITGVLWMLFFGYFVCFALKVSPLMSYSDWCLVASCVVWFSLPSSLAVPLLFLYRADKNMLCCANNA